MAKDYPNMPCAVFIKADGDRGSCGFNAPMISAVTGAVTVPHDPKQALTVINDHHTKWNRPLCTDDPASVAVVGKWTGTSSSTCRK